MIEETDDDDDDDDDDDLYSDIAEVEYEYDEEDYEDADEENEARSVPTDPLGISFSDECCVVSNVYVYSTILSLLPGRVIHFFRNQRSLLDRNFRLVLALLELLG